MTAIAPAPASGHAPLEQRSAHAAPGALLQAHDPVDFAAVLDSVPGGDAKAKPYSGERAQRPSDSPPRDRAETQIPNPSFYNVALAPALPVAALTTIANEEPAAETDPPALAPKAAAQRPAPDAASPPRVANAQAGGALGARLIDERSFHVSAAASTPATAPPIDGPSSAAQPPAAAIVVWDAPEAAVQSPPTVLLRRSQATAPSLTVSPWTPPVASASHAERGPVVGSGPVPLSGGRARVERQTDPATTTARVAAPVADKPASRPEASPALDGSESGGSGGSADLATKPEPGAPQSSPSLTLAALTQPLAAAQADPESQPADAATGQGAPRAARTPAASPAPVREIDVDLSPGGLEDVSMTMRLAGDKLSLVIRAGSSQTTGAIEGARDAIAERLAAIGQPLGSLIIQQTGSTTDATNARDAGDRGGESRPQSRGGDANDSRGARRGSGGF